MNGKFIVVEGLEGSGKTSAIKTIFHILKKNNISNIISTREPGDTPIAEKLRFLIKKKISNESLTNYAELLMFYAARVQLVENVIKPALSKGIWVLGDRHDLSTQAYQGGGRGIDSSFINLLRKKILGEFEPDLTLYLDISPKVGLSRIDNRKFDRIEISSLRFFHRTRARYLELAHQNNKIIIIDANKPLKIVQHYIHLKISQWLHQNQ